MKTAFIFSAVLSALSAFCGEEPLPLGAGLGAQRVQIQSKPITTLGWRRDVVMVDGEGEIRGDGGIVADKASTDAIDEVARDSETVSLSSNEAMLEALEYLYESSRNIASNCVQFALAIAPESVRSNLTGYVVKTVTTNGVDHQWVWYNRKLALKPNRVVVYSMFGKEEKVKANWVNWDEDGVSLTVAGRTWQGCHECTVERPDFAAENTCLDNPNEIWGGDEGIDWGDMLLTDGDKPYFTGFVTNGISGAVLYFDNGFLKNNPTQEN